jgi:hypothetical protein
VARWCDSPCLFALGNSKIELEIWDDVWRCEKPSRRAAGGAVVAFLSEETNSGFAHKAQ